ncbi:MAG: helix-turn-helix domain-containing protein [Puniceicoccales bacterium]|jgi:transcriptional regulator with XRE-family HTH domain|nr:helix-turn-helix domain-containing protein [Puniceicoccales bacterium]
MMDSGTLKEGDSGFGLRFRLLLGYHDLTLRDVSEFTGAAISTVSTWRNGRIPSSQQVIEAIARIFKVTPSYLIYGVTKNREVELADADQEIFEIEDCISQKFQENILDGDLRKGTQRQKIEYYIACYLDEAEKFEGGLEHAWLQLLKEFPLNWFSLHGDYLSRRQLVEGEQPQKQEQLAGKKLPPMV